MLAVIIGGGFKRAQVKADLIYLKTFTPGNQRATIGLTLFGGVLLTVNWLTFIYIVNNINIKTASFSYLLCPVVTAVLGYVLLREKLTVLQWCAVGICGISCLIMGLHFCPRTGL